MQEPKKVIRIYISETVGSIDGNVAQIKQGINNAIKAIQQIAAEEHQKFDIEEEDIHVSLIDEYSDYNDSTLVLETSFDVPNENYDKDLKRYKAYLDRLPKPSKESIAWHKREEEAGDRNYDRWRS